MLSNIITPRVRQWMRNGRSAHVLHRFNEVINLVNDQGELIAAATPAVGPGPFTMVLDGDFQSYFAVGRPVQIDSQAQTLTSGQLVIETKQAAVWQPRPDWSRLRDAALTGLPPAALLSAEIESYLHQLLTGVTCDDEAMGRAAVFGLAGRGRGLTPTGDDVLMGVLYGLWVWQPRQKWMEMIAATAVPRTTTLSANFIRAAAAGEAAWQWHDLVNGRAHAIAQILSIGHTSGADAWAGFIHTAHKLSPQFPNTII